MKAKKPKKAEPPATPVETPTETATDTAVEIVIDPTLLARASWYDVDQALGRIRDNQALVDAVRADKQAEVARLEENVALAIVPQIAAIAEDEAFIKAFVGRHREELAGGKKGRSKKLVHGVVGIRTSAPKLEFLVDEAHTLRMCEVRKLDQCIVTKKVLAKDELKDLPAQEQAVVGVETTTSESVYYKLSDAEKIAHGGVQ